MYRSTAKYVLDTLLLLSVVGVVVTGVVTDQLGLHGFILHRWIGYTMAALAAIHVALNWRPLVHFSSGGHRRGGARSPMGPHLSPSAGAAVPRAAEDEAPSPSLTRRPELSRRAALAAVGAGVIGAVAGWFTRVEVAPTPYRGGDVGLFYHRESSLGLRGLLSNVLDWGRRPPRYKPSGDGDSVALPAVVEPPTMSVARALEQRRSRREYADRSMTAEELAWLMYAATGITSPDERRTAPSAGALYPIETYVAVTRVDGIDAGLYHLDVRAQALQPVRSGSVAGDLLVAGLGQEFLREAPVVLVFTGLFQRTRWKYHDRHYRYVCWEAGHIAQNVYLSAEAAGLGACMVGSFLDGSLNDLLRVNGHDEAALGLVAVGPH